MTPHQRARARDLFQQLCDVPKADQAHRLDEVCADDPEVRSLVAGMLREDPGDDASFAPLVSPSNASHLAAAIAEAPGMTIGPYRIMRVLGEGGFGTVFLAEQSTPLRREVALKVVKLGMDTRQVVARFQQERQAMALLDHPNIARVYDAGATDTGRPYFAMEVCPGDPVTKYCDSARATIEQRIALMCTVCRAVQHAHQRGLIHRDLKPSNILVATVDGEPVPKVIDFGIAKALRPDLHQGATLSVQQQYIGTPEYTSPEQASGEGDVDTRADVYSLGVLLYELLTGETPIPSKTLRKGTGQSLHLVIATTEVSAPSTRIRVGSDHSTTISTLRATEPLKLRAQLRRDLDWVVLRAIDKDRELRYSSAAELAQDLERYLAGEAVSAAPPSTWYALRKSARRHRTVVVAASLVLLSLLLGMAGTIMQAREARKEAAAARVAEAAQKRLAEAEAQRSRELQTVSEFQAEMLRTFDAFAIGNNLSKDLHSRLLDDLRQEKASEDDSARVLGSFDIAMRRINTTDVATGLLNREILVPTLRAIDDRFADQPRVRGLLHANIGRAYNTLSLRPECVAQYRTAIDLLTPVLGADDRAVLEMRQREFLMLVTLEHTGALQQEGPDLLERVRRVLPENDPVRLITEREWANALRKLGRLQESADAHLATLAACRRLLPPSSDLIMMSSSMTASVLTELGRLDEAETLLRGSVGNCMKFLGPTHETTLWNKYSLANTLAAGKKFDEAKGLLDEVIEARTRLNGREHARTLVTVMLRAEVLERRGDTDDAEGEYREVLRGFGTRRGVDTFRAETSSRLAVILVARKDFAAAEQLLEQQILLVDKTRAIALLRELDAVYDEWARQDRSVDTTNRREAVKARLNALAPESSR